MSDQSQRGAPRLAVASISDPAVPPSLDAEPAGASHPDSVGHYFARFGTFYFRVDASTDPPEARKKLISALDADPRVSEVRVDELRPAWTHLLRQFPVLGEINTNSLLSGGDSFAALNMSDPVFFRVHVPIKNQPLFRDETDVPTADYWVAWDGITLIALWDRERGSRLPPRSGGHVVSDIVRDATRRAGFDLVVQPCSPGCTNMFAHRVVRITQYPAAEGEPNLSYENRGFPVVQAHMHQDGGAEQALEILFKDMSRLGYLFAQYKNSGLRVRAIEDRARTLVSSLLSLDYLRILERSATGRERAILAFRGLRQSARRVGVRAESERLIAMIWLAMSNIEALRRDWVVWRRRLDDSSDSRGRRVIHDIDRKDDDATVESMDVGFLRSAVEQRSGRIDNQVIVLATLAGALGAALVAFVAALLA
jgi:hypothetical protein